MTLPRVGNPLPQTVLGEAEELVYGGPRNQDYGHPKESCDRIARFWNTYISAKYDVPYALGAEDVAMMLLLMKVSREIGGHKRDNLVDVAGYCGVYARVIGEDE